MSAESFEVVKDQIGCCGAWCGSCVVGNGALMQLARKYRALIDAYGVKEWGPKEVDYEALARALQSIEAIPACPGCRLGGGRENCEIRACAASRSLQECTQCDAGARCKHPDVLNYMRTGARDAGILFRDGPPDRTNPIQDWTARLASTWPCSIIFEDEN